MRPHAAPPRYYEVRLAGHLDPSWVAAFDGLDLSLDPDGTTTLRGELADQAALHGLLGQVRDLGLTLLTVETTRRPTDLRSPR